MVSIKRNIGLLFINFIIFLCFMGLYTISNAAICTSSQAPCCKGTTLSCCSHPGYDSKGNELSYDLSACTQIDGPVIDGPIIDGGDIIGPIDPVFECTSGQSQYKPNGDCGTSERTCCSNLKWSGWDEACPSASSCGLNECWNGSSCVKKGSTSRSCSSSVANASSGTQTRTATCKSGTGWSYGSWTGTCTCKTGYTWSSGSCVSSGSSCKCTINERLITYSDGSCCCEFKTCGQTTSGGLVSPCKCLAGDANPGLNLSWEKAGTPCWDKIDCGTGELPECNESRKGSYWSKWVSDNTWNSACGSQYPYINGRGYCQQYYCR